MAADRFGTDLAVLRGPAAHDTEACDLRELHRPPRRGSASTADRIDLETRSARDNLGQALILRLLTPRGSLAELGHAAYGSRLHELIGRGKDENARHLCRAFVLEALAQEPRIEPKAVALTFEPATKEPSSLRFTVTVRPREGGEDLPLTLDVAL